MRLRYSYIVIALIVLILASFAIIRYLDLSSKEGSENSKKNVSTLLGKKADAAGYKIYWQGDINDTTGRTILADGKRSEELFPEEFWWKIEKNHALNLIDFPVGFGIFKKWKKVPGSKDMYMILENPETKSFEQDTLEARIVIDETAKAGTYSGTLSATKLLVDNLDYGYKNKKVASSSLVGLFKNINQEDLDKIIRPGDIVQIINVPLKGKDARVRNRLILADEVQTPYALSIIIRRFGGIATLKSELK